MYVVAKEMALTWGSPNWLWLLCLIPWLIGGLLLNARWRNRTTAHFGKASTVSPLITGKPYWWRWLHGLLFIISLALIIIAIASPQYGSRTRVLKKQGIDVVIALDFSKSMLAQDVHPSRIERAKSELNLILNDLKGDRVGLVAFAGETIEFPMTVDYSAIRLFLRDLDPMDLPVGGTAIGKALIAAKRLIERSTLHSDNPNGTETHKRARVVILMTDGEDHAGNPIAAAEELKQAGIKVYSIGIGSRTGQPIPVYAEDGTLVDHMKDRSGQLVMTSLSHQNEQVLKCIASITGGDYISAPEGTVGITEIQRALNQFQKSEQQSRHVTVYENRFAIVLLPGFLLLVLEALLPEAWFFTRRKKRET